MFVLDLSPKMVDDKNGEPDLKVQYTCEAVNHAIRTLPPEFSTTQRNLRQLRWKGRKMLPAILLSRIRLEPAWRSRETLRLYMGAGNMKAKGFREEHTNLTKKSQGTAFIRKLI